jgi:hypothetical protein
MFRSVQCLSNLGTIAVAYAKVGDAGVRGLKGLRKLTQIDAKGLEVTAEWASEVKRVLPGVTINH